MSLFMILLFYFTSKLTNYEFLHQIFTPNFYTKFKFLIYSCLLIIFSAPISTHAQDPCDNQIIDLNLDGCLECFSFTEAYPGEAQNISWTLYSKYYTSCATSDQAVFCERMRLGLLFQIIKGVKKLENSGRKSFNRKKITISSINLKKTPIFRCSKNLFSI